MSRPMWRVYEVRSNSCSSAPNTISTCSTELRSPSSRLSTRLRTSRPPSWASAQWSVAPSPIDGLAMLERRPCSAARSWMLATASSAPGREMDLERAGEQRLRRRSALGAPATPRAPRRPTPPRPRRARRSSGSGAPGPGSPAGQRRTIGRSRRTPARHADRRRPGSSAARVSWASLSSSGQRRRRRAARAGAGSRRSAAEVSRTTPAARQRRRGERVDAVLAERGEAGDAVGQRRGAVASASRRVPRRRTSSRSAARRSTYGV